jgi:hypothetical protein
MPDDIAENTGNRIAWFASGFAAAALLCGILLYSDGYFGKNNSVATADVPGTIIEGK